MSRIEKKLKLSDEKFKRRIGTTKAVFRLMLAILQVAYHKLHEQGGKPPDLTVGDKLLITLKYYREYTTMESIADDYDCSKSSVADPRYVRVLLGSAGKANDLSRSVIVDKPQYRPSAKVCGSRQP